MTEKTYKIGEAAALLRLKSYVLRFWETEFPQLVPLRNITGQRFYSEQDLELLKQIKRLLHEQGLTIEGAKKVLDKNKLNQNINLAAASYSENNHDNRQSLLNMIKINATSKDNDEAEELYPTPLSGSINKNDSSTLSQSDNWADELLSDSLTITSQLSDFDNTEIIPDDFDFEHKQIQIENEDNLSMSNQQTQGDKLNFIEQSEFDDRKDEFIEHQDTQNEQDEQDEEIEESNKINLIGLRLSDFELSDINLNVQLPKNKENFYQKQDITLQKPNENSFLAELSSKVTANNSLEQKLSDADKLNINTHAHSVSLEENTSRTILLSIDEFAEIIKELNTIKKILLS